jgi:hypothetical protein
MEVFEELKNCYVVVLSNLISFLQERDLTPPKYIIKINLISEKYLRNNALYFIELGLKNILPHKTKILNIMKDEDSIDKNTLTQNFNNLNEMDIILEVIMNLKKLDAGHKIFVKSSIEVLIMTLDKIYITLQNI